VWMEAAVRGPKNTDFGRKDPIIRRPAVPAFEQERRTRALDSRHTKTMLLMGKYTLSTPHLPSNHTIAVRQTTPTESCGRREAARRPVGAGSTPKLFDGPAGDRARGEMKG